ncbi:hypothetical protein [Roseiarcus fermentans]|nr:hypothetical protein [Roseiarcus fermentans]
MKTLDEDVTAAEMETVSVQADLRARKAVPIGADVRKRPEALLEHEEE